MDLFREVIRDNAGWVLATVTLLAVVLAFIYGGSQWMLIGLFIAMAVAIYALWRTAVKRGKRLAESPPPRNVDQPVTAEGSGTSSEVEAAESGPVVGATSQEDSNIRDELAATHATDQAGAAEAVKGPPVLTGKGAPTKPQVETPHDPLELAQASATARDIGATSNYLDLWDKADLDDTAEGHLKHLALRDQLLAIAGSGDALIRLRQLADDNPKESVLVGALAAALRRRGETRSAADELAQRRRAVENDSPAILAVQEAKLRRQLKEFDVAAEVADSVLHGANVGERTKVSALIERGYALEHLDRRIEAFGSFERALAIDPTNQGIRYHLAHEYSEDGLNELALNHYEQLLANSVGTSWVVGASLNNIGVALTSFRIPMHAVNQFRASAESGNALAAANLAHLLLDHGFVEEAKESLEMARALDPGNERSATATARIASEFGKEEERLSQRREAGERLRLVFNRIGEAPTEAPLPGVYRTDDGADMILGPDEHGNIGTKLADGSKVSFVVDGVSLIVERSHGLINITKQFGRGHCRGGNLTFYLRDYPTNGQSMVYRATQRES